MSKIEAAHADSSFGDSATEEPGPPQVAAGKSTSDTAHKWLDIGERLALPTLLVAVIVFFSVLPSSSVAFRTSENWTAITANQSVICLIALASIFPLLAGHFDFSIAANASLCSVAAAATMSRHGGSIMVAIVVALVFGGCIGWLNGLLVGRLRLNSFVTTLGIATLLAGIVSYYTENQMIVTDISATITDFGSQQWFGLPRVTVLVLAVAAMTWYGLERTPAGRRLQAIGSNPRSARLVGIPVERYTSRAYVMGGVMAGIAGVMLVARQGGSTADPGTTSLLFPALTAVFLGATAITPGRFNVLGTLVGVLLVAVSVSGLTLAGASDWVSPVFNGSALVVAVALSTFLARRRGEGALA